MLMTISLEMSMKKLVRLTAHTLRGSERHPVLRLGVAGGVMVEPPGHRMPVL
jgi:hypothetical protein